jgi:hypothetical protein
LENNPKVADIQVNESNVVYTTAAGGEALASAALTSGSSQEPFKILATGCESAD